MRGFTLIELLVVFLIIAAALAVAVPMLGPTSSGARIESDVRALATFLREARSDAIASNREIAVTVSTETRSYSVQSTGRKGRFSSEVNLSMTAARIEQIDQTTGGFRFFPDGSSTGGEIYIEAESSDFVVKIEWLTGRVAFSPR